MQPWNTADGHCEVASLQEAADRDLAARVAIAFGQVLAEVRKALEGTDADNDACAAMRAGRMSSVLRHLSRGERMASDLLAYAGHQTLHPSMVEIMPVLCSLADLLRHTLDWRTDVVVDVDADCQPCHVDADALHAALFHLAINSRNAMPCGGRMVFHAHAAALPNGEPAVAIDLMDSGNGMPPDVEQCATSPFFTTKCDDRLAGLGLSAAQGFARQSGGSLNLRTWMGRGTCVTLILPAFDRRMV